MRESLRLGLAILLLANTATGSTAVSAAIIASCSISSSTLAFGTYDPIVTNSSAALTVSGNALSVSCTRGAPGVTIGLGAGSNAAHAVGTTRAMASGSNYLSYDLYTTSGYSTVWNSSNTVSYSSMTFAPKGVTVYGSAPGGQDLPIASYSDSVLATVNF